MKANLIGAIAAVLLMSAATFAQTFTRETPIWQDDVPEPVLQTFKSAYPKANPRSYTKVEVNGVPLFSARRSAMREHKRLSTALTNTIATTK